MLLNELCLKLFGFCSSLRGFSFLLCSPGPVQPAREMQKTEDSFHESAAAGTGASVQTEQVFVPT